MNTIGKPVIKGAIVAGILLAVYFGALTFISGGGFALSQFAQPRYFIVSLVVLAVCIIIMFRRHRHSTGDDHEAYVTEVDETDQRTGPAHEDMKSDHSCCH